MASRVDISMTYLRFRNYLFRGLTFLFFIIPLSANAIEIKLHPSNKSENLNAVLVTGDIEPGDTSRLVDFIHSCMAQWLVYQLSLPAALD
jgi:hypothetical protein